MKCQYCGKEIFKVYIQGKEVKMEKFKGGLRPHTCPKQFYIWDKEK